MDNFADQANVLQDGKGRAISCMSFQSNTAAAHFWKLSKTGLTCRLVCVNDLQTNQSGQALKHGHRTNLQPNQCLDSVVTILLRAVKCIVYSFLVDQECYHADKQTGRDSSPRGSPYWRLLIAPLI